MGFGAVPPSAAPVNTGATVAQTAKQVLPGAKADAAARAGGGISPGFLANLVSQQSGTPGSGLDIIGQIRQSLGGGA